MAELANILGPITIIVLIGYTLERAALGLQMETLGTLVLLVATPSLIFHTLVSMDVSLGELGHMAFAALLVMSVCMVLAGLVLSVFGASLRLYLPSLVFPNSGNMGLALVLLTFGDEGMKFGISYFLTVSVVQHSLGFSFSSGSVDLRHLARQPLVISIVMVLVVLGFGLQVPQVIMNTTELLGGLMIPSMLIVLGASLATLKIADLPPALGLAIARLTFGLASAALAIWALDLSGVSAGVVFLLATMPIAIVNHIYAHKFFTNATTVSGAIAVSTLLTFLCLPALIWASLWIAGNG